MRRMILVALLGLAAQQPARAQAVRPRSDVIPPRPAPQTPHDSTVEAINELGIRVASLKSALDLYRRAAFNDPTGTVIERAGVFRDACLGVVTSAQSAQRMVCRSCLPREPQAAVDAYRNYLPGLIRLGQQCAARVDLLRGRHATGREADAAAARLKAEVRPMSARITEGLRPYEERLLAVRRQFGWEQPVIPARRPD